MSINIEHIRAETENYRRSFCEKWKVVYGSDFLQDTREAKHCAKAEPSYAARCNIDRYQKRIRFIKSIIEKK